jgi:hypothetical protein
LVAIASVAVIANLAEVDASVAAIREIAVTAVVTGRQGERHR